MTDPLESARAKLHRADNQIRGLREQFHAGWDKHLYGISTFEDLMTGETVVTVAKPHSLFIDYSIKVGEVVHHMRSALDHAVWQMVPNPKEGVTGFPVFTLKDRDPVEPKKRYFERHGLRIIDGINPAAATVIRNLQPFATSKDQRLRILNDMWNWEKHRLLNMMVILPQGIAPWYRYLIEGHIRTLPFINIPADLDDGAEIARVPHPSDFVQGEVRMEAEVAISIQFADGPAKGKSPEEFLTSLWKYAIGVIDALGKTI